MILKKLFVTFLALVVWGLQGNADEIPRKEYPRPQFERKAWLNLNGEWDYTFDFTNIGMEKGFHKATAFDGKITVDSNERGKALQVKVISHIQNRPQKSKAEIDAISLFWSEKDIEMDGAKSPYCICSL